MSEITLAAKIEIFPSDEEKEILLKTLDAYRKGCVFAADYAKKHNCYSFAALNRAVYHDLREKYGLKSQMAQSVVRDVIAKYDASKTSTGRQIQPKFKKPQISLVYNRDWSFKKDEKVSLNSLNGRIVVPYSAKGMESCFTPGARYGTLKILYRKGRFYLSIPVTHEIKDCDIGHVSNIVGIDRGTNFIANSYDNDGHTIFFNGRFVKQKRAHYQDVYTSLQKKGTPSSRRRLKAIGGRESRWMSDINHQVAKTLVHAYAEDTLFVLEDLTGIRKVTETVHKSMRRSLVSWSFYDLEQKIIYKARWHKCAVIKVDAAYTSQTCPICGHVEKTNRNRKMHAFCCRNCSYRSNDDRVAAMNLNHAGNEYLSTPEGAKVPHHAALVSAAK